MHALPPDLDESNEEQVTGLTCPDCFGVLGVVVEGAQQALRLRCRTGHAYSPEEIVMGKEARLEEHLWAALTILDEVIVFLRELAARPDTGALAPAYGQRVTQAEAQAAVVRGLLQRLERTTFDGGEADDCSRR